MRISKMRHEGGRLPGVPNLGDYTVVYKRKNSLSLVQRLTFVRLSDLGHEACTFWAFTIFIVKQVL